MFFEYKSYSVETLEHILENMPYGIWLSDAEGDIQYINQNAAEVYNKIYDKRNKVRNCKKSISWKRKKIFDILEIPLLDEEDRVKGVIGMTKYAVRQSDVDRVLRKDLYFKQREKKKIIGWKNEKLIQMIGAEGILICEYDKKESSLKGIYRISSFPADVLDKFEMALSETKVQELINSKSVWEMDEFCEQIGLSERSDLKRLGIRYVYQYPVTYNNEIVGFLIISYKDKLKNSAMEHVAINRLSKYIGAALKNNQLSQEMRNELERKDNSEKKLKDILDIATDFICINDEKGNLIEGNFEEWKSLGWSYEELVDINSDGTQRIKYTEHVLEEDVEATNEVLNQIINEKRNVEYTNRWYCKDGSYKWIRWVVRYLEEKKCFLTVGTDVSEIIKMKNERLLYEETLKLESLKRNFLSM